MNVTFDPDKDAANLAKHGLLLSDAAGLEWDAALLWSDQRKDYQEARMVGLVPAGGRLFAWYLLNDRQSDRHSGASSV